MIWRKPWGNTYSIFLSFCVVPKTPAGQVFMLHFKDWSPEHNAISLGPASTITTSHVSRQKRGKLLEELEEFALSRLP